MAGGRRRQGVGSPFATAPIAICCRSAYERAAASASREEHCIQLSTAVCFSTVARACTGMREHAHRASPSGAMPPRVSARVCASGHHSLQLPHRAVSMVDSSSCNGGAGLLEREAAKNYVWVASTGHVAPSQVQQRTVVDTHSRRQREPRLGDAPRRPALKSTRPAIRTPVYWDWRGRLRTAGSRPRSSSHSRSRNSAPR